MVYYHSAYIQVLAFQSSSSESESRIPIRELNQISQRYADDTKYTKGPYTKTKDSSSTNVSTNRQPKQVEEPDLQVKGTSNGVLGGEGLDTLLRMENLALKYSIQGRWKEAEQL